MTTAAPSRLPKLAVEDLEREERQRVANDMQVARTPEDRLRLSAKIVEQAVADAPKDLRVRRDQAALHLSLYDGTKAVYDAVGLSRAFFHDKRVKALGLTKAERGTWLKNASQDDVARRAAERGVPRVEDAARTAVVLAEHIVRADARATAARAFRDTAVAELLRAGWSRHQVAEVGGFDDSRVSQIKTSR